MAEVRGSRSKPRVLLVGSISEDEETALQRQLPSASLARNKSGAAAEHPSEIDLVVAADCSMVTISKYMRRHAILFGTIKLEQTELFTFQGGAPAREYTLPFAPPTLDALRRRDLADVHDVRRWPMVLAGKEDLQAEELLGGALAIPKGTPGVALGFAAWREKCAAGVAWIPWETSHRVDWTVAFVELWAERDRDGFANIVPWRRHVAWMTSAERDQVSARERLDAEEARIVAEFVQRRAEVEHELAMARAVADAGPRRLLTATGDELVDAVADVLRDLGFTVDIVDQQLGPGQRKREDLRVRHPDYEDWEVVVEVKGYSRSGGKVEDLTQLQRHVTAYIREHGKDPSAQWLVINGQAEFPPDRRSEPMAGQDLEIEGLAAENGMVISTVDLFRAATAGKPNEVCVALHGQRGRFKWP